MSVSDEFLRKNRLRSRTSLEAIELLTQKQTFADIQSVRGRIFPKHYFGLGNKDKKVGPTWPVAPFQRSFAESFYMIYRGLTSDLKSLLEHSNESWNSKLSLSVIILSGEFISLLVFPTSPKTQLKLRQKFNSKIG